MRAVRWDEIPDEFVRPGVRRRGFGTDRCLLVMNECTPGMDLRPHVHDFDQIALIVSGMANYYVGDEREASLQRASLASEIARLLPGFGRVNYPDWDTLCARFWPVKPMGLPTRMSPSVSA